MGCLVGLKMANRLLEPHGKQESAAFLAWAAEAGNLLQQGWTVSTVPFREPE